MLPATKNEAIVKKSTFKREYQVLDGTPTKKNPTMADIQQDIANGVLTPVNLTGSTITAKIAPKAGATPTIAFTTQVVDAAAGKFKFFLTAAQTAALSGTWPQHYDVRIDIGGTGTNVITYVSGSINLIPAVS